MILGASLSVVVPGAEDGSGATKMEISYANTGSYYFPGFFYAESNADRIVKVRMPLGMKLTSSRKSPAPVPATVALDEIALNYQLMPPGPGKRVFVGFLPMNAVYLEKKVFELTGPEVQNLKELNVLVKSPYDAESPASKVCSKLQRIAQDRGFWVQPIYAYRLLKREQVTEEELRAILEPRVLEIPIECEVVKLFLAVLNAGKLYEQYGHGLKQDEAGNSEVLLSQLKLTEELAQSGFGPIATQAEILRFFSLGTCGRFSDAKLSMKKIEARNLDMGSDAILRSIMSEVEAKLKQ
jgi:hypothetical protein